MIGKVVRWTVVLFTVVAYQGLLATYLAPRGTGLRWEILVVLLAGMAGGTIRGIVAGGMVGFLSDCLAPEFLGWGMMVKATLGAVMGMSREHIFMERLAARWLILAAGIAVHDILYLIPVSGFDLARYGHTLAVSTTISTTVTSTVGIVALLLWPLATRTVAVIGFGETREASSG